LPHFSTVSPVHLTEKCSGAALVNLVPDRRRHATADCPAAAASVSGPGVVGPDHRPGGLYRMN
jgi:hypothetical protein